MCGMASTHSANLSLICIGQQKSIGSAEQACPDQFGGTSSKRK